MAVYRRESTVEAPLADVWDFLVRPSHLEAVTPAFVGLEIAAVRGPDGESRALDEPLEAGAEVDVQTGPFGLGGSGWTSTIEEFERGDDAGHFRDLMHDGPFARWDHTHRVEARGEGRTAVVDRVDYRLGTPLPGDAVDPLARIGLEPMFRYRHRKVREALE